MSESTYLLVPVVKTLTKGNEISLSKFVTYRVPCSQIIRKRHQLARTVATRCRDISIRIDQIPKNIYEFILSLKFTNYHHENNTSLRQQETLENNFFPITIINCKRNLYGRREPQINYRRLIVYQNAAWQVVLMVNFLIAV